MKKYFSFLNGSSTRLNMDSNDSESDNDFEGWSNLETNKTFEGGKYFANL